MSTAACDFVLYNLPVVLVPDCAWSQSLECGEIIGPAAQSQRPRSNRFCIYVSCAMVAAIRSCARRARFALSFRARVAPVPIWFGAALCTSQRCCALARAVVAQLRQPGLRSAMTTISITIEACAAVEAAFPRGLERRDSHGRQGRYLLTLPDGMINLLNAISPPGESYSNAIVRITR
jgi:hypothetical protein